MLLALREIHTMQVTIATVDSYFVLLGIISTVQLQRDIRASLENCFKAELPLHACGSLVTCVVVTRVRSVVRMRVGSGQTVIGYGWFVLLKVCNDISNTYEKILKKEVIRALFQSHLY